jgi:hypothetical protein
MTTESPFEAIFNGLLQQNRHFSEVLNPASDGRFGFKTRTWANRRDRALAHWKSEA